MVDDCGDEVIRVADDVVVVRLGEVPNPLGPGS